MFNNGHTLKDIADYYKKYTRLVLDKDKFKHVRKNNKEFDFVFDNILKRFNYIQKD